MKFYEMTAAQRLAQLVEEGAMTAETAAIFAGSGALSADVAASLSENQLGQFSLPLGVARQVPVAGRVVNVPMVTEEPSVVAAASNGARLLRAGAGVQITLPPHTVRAEIVFDGLPDLPAAQALVAAHEALFKQVADDAHPSAVQRGGGLKAQTVAVIADRFLKIGLIIAPGQAMGANLANTIAEAVGQAAGKLLNSRPLTAILTNRDEAIGRATVAVPLDALATGTRTGAEVATGIAALSALAEVDEDRAVTHNKGILNGIEAAVLATGNDTRAVAAAIYAHAGATGRMSPLATWRQTATELVGSIALPLPVGILGGAIRSLPVAQASLALGGFTTVADLQGALLALGLAQNLAALRAQVGPGLQAGHMKLQARNLAISIGATGKEIGQLAAALSSGVMSEAAAQTLLDQMRKEQHS
ncbi:hydroxymethylglutaryl-CoA reductase, degradative [Lacticaseibacillus mingshuiensis]|uniref:hydroxymethylglutaryl-CoA reductase, degradative n=1 Tax=Lacticaseibacillus mingshuiensis TaxID=2799574 RepID=UPI00194E4DE1|nr:hydroxymethylglutaryl-CoA reductase, degradative [Lacticaseibacillus mingshuiensis]